MTYSNSICAKIGRHLIKSDPQAAETIIKKIVVPRVDIDVEKIPDYFLTYCTKIGVQPEDQQGPVLDRSRSELNKVFIASMLVMYNDQRLVKKHISIALKKKPPKLSPQVSEVKFRYQKDIEFKTKVDNTLKIFL